jgi:hypothetical protein
LLSLNSFEKYATKSIRQGLFNNDIELALEEFRKLKFNEWRNSEITKCANTSFANKVDFLFSQLSKDTSDDTPLKEEIKNLFKFSSEFTHIGYISTFFTAQAGSQPIFGGDKSPYLLSTENFSELKYQIIETCINFIYQIYLPSILISIDKTVSSSESDLIRGKINNLILLLENGIKTRNNDYYFFVRAEMIGSKETLELPCLCGYTNNWLPPHDNSDLFCTGCGSSYNVIALDGDPGFVFTSNGPTKVIGSTVPDFQDLPLEEQKKIMKNFEEMSLNSAKAK